MCVVSGVMLEKRSSKEVSAQDSSAIEWKWFLQEHAAGGRQGGFDYIHEQVAPFPLTSIWGPARPYWHTGGALWTALDWPTKSCLVRR